MELHDIVDTTRHPITDAAYIDTCRKTLDGDGALVLTDFLRPDALAAIQAEARSRIDRAYFCAQDHTVYLTPRDPSLPDSHAANRTVVSSKGCICDDDVAADSPLRTLYDARTFRAFVRGVTGETVLHAYADPLSSINVHYARRGQELGWHFDNSSFAITLLIQKPDAGSRFEFVKDLRRSGDGDMNHEGVTELLDGRLEPQVLSMDAGTLVLFRGRDSVHRVSPNESDTVRMLAVLAYNAEAGVELSPHARMTFYGRLD